MKNNIGLVYYNASMGLGNPFSSITHSVLYRVINQSIPGDSVLYQKTKGFGLGFYICTKKGNNELKIFGPARSKKYEVLDYSIFLPESLSSIDEYITLVFQGIKLVVSKYGLQDSEIESIELECRKELGIG